MAHSEEEGKGTLSLNDSPNPLLVSAGLHKEEETEKKQESPLLMQIRGKDSSIGFNKPKRKMIHHKDFRLPHIVTLANDASEVNINDERSPEVTTEIQQIGMMNNHSSTHLSPKFKLSKDGDITLRSHHRGPAQRRGDISIIRSSNLPPLAGFAATP